MTPPRLNAQEVAEARDEYIKYWTSMGRTAAAANQHPLVVEAREKFEALVYATFEAEYQGQTVTVERVANAWCGVPYVSYRVEGKNLTCAEAREQLKVS